MNKKGIFFTILAIILLSLLLISTGIYSVFQDRSSINSRINTINNFIFSLEKDISRQGYIAGYRAILSLGDYITSTGSFLNDSEQSIREAILNGTIENKTLNLMEGYTLPELNLRISEFAKKMNIEINYSLKNLSVSQDSPWEVKIDIEMEILIKDTDNLASWNKTENISSRIKIVDFEDPLYIIGTKGLIANKIKETSYEPFVSGSNVSNLFAHVNSSSYIASPLAPSFLNRLEGNLTADINGIESLVYLPRLSSQGLATKEKSVVDYIYFSEYDPESYHVQGMPTWFRIDYEHLGVYGVEELI
ncbi:MAG: hypothetical protein WC494_00940 [Candidatus Pacearchaeota archaeon]